VIERPAAPAAERLFFALWPPSSVRAQIEAFTNQLGNPRGRRMASPNLHITLLFLGRINAGQRDALIAAASALHLPAFMLTLDRCGHWPRSGVLWLAPAVTPGALSDLQDSLTAGARMLDLKIDEREYLPHLSLYRDVKRVPGTLPSPRIRWPVRDFVLVRSDTHPDGAYYTVLQRWRLGG